MALAAFAALVPNNVLDLTPVGVLNVHPSLLPRWRGAAPIQSALWAGDTTTGVSIIRLVQALDAGPILLQAAVPIGAEDDYVSLEPRLAQLGGQLLVQALADQPPGQPQPDAGATFSRKIERADGHIDWSQSAEAIWRQVRALRGWPQAFTTWNGRTLKVTRAWPVASVGGAPGEVCVRDAQPVVATGDGGLRLDEVVLEGKRAQNGAELLRGYRGLVGANLA
jgi:methionyl-tRNA formyltransferase